MRDIGSLSVSIAVWVCVSRSTMSIHDRIEIEIRMDLDTEIDVSIRFHTRLQTTQRRGAAPPAPRVRPRPRPRCCCFSFCFCDLCGVVGLRAGAVAVMRCAPPVAPSHTSGRSACRAGLPGGTSGSHAACDSASSVCGLRRGACSRRAVGGPPRLVSPSPKKERARARRGRGEKLGAAQWRVQP